MTDSLNIGETAPAFSLPGSNGATVRLADFRGRKLVLFFFPKADTPGCTREAAAFSGLAPQFQAADTAVLGVSADPPATQERFRTKHAHNVALLCDERHEMLQAYHAWGEKFMYGKAFVGVLRTTYLIDRTGRIARAWSKVKVDGHAEEVLAAAQALP